MRRRHVSASTRHCRRPRRRTCASTTRSCCGCVPIRRQTWRRRCRSLRVRERRSSNYGLRWTISSCAASERAWRLSMCWAEFQATVHCRRWPGRESCWATRHSLERATTRSPGNSSSVATSWSQPRRTSAWPRGSALAIAGDDAYVLVTRENEGVRGRRDIDVLMARAMVATHHCEVLDNLSCLGMVEAPHHTIFAQFNVGCADLYDELMRYFVVLQLRRPSLLGVY